MIGNTQPSNTVAMNAGVAIYEVPTGISASYCITTGTNAIVKGPFNVPNGAIFTVPNGSYWVVL